MFYDPSDPADWAGSSLEYVADGVVLASFPPTVGFRDALGVTDDYAWDHEPGSGAWWPRGDGVPDSPPRLALSGTHTYRSDFEAADHTAALETAHLTATALHWRGQFLCALRTDVRGKLTVQSGDAFAQATFLGLLNLTAPLTRRAIREAMF